MRQVFLEPKEVELLLALVRKEIDDLDKAIGNATSDEPLKKVESMIERSTHLLSIRRVLMLSEIEEIRKGRGVEIQNGEVVGGLKNK